MSHESYNTMNVFSTALKAFQSHLTLKFWLAWICVKQTFLDDIKACEKRLYHPKAGG